MLIALAALLFGFVSTVALAVIGRELRDHRGAILQALGIGAQAPRMMLSRHFRVIERRRIAPINLAERRPVRVAA